MLLITKALHKVDKIIERSFVVLGAVFLAIVFVSCGLQVFTRYILNNSLSWTEEVSRYSVIWATLMGSVLATKYGAHCAVSVLDSFFKGKAKIVKDVFVLCCVLAVGCVMLINGSIYVAMTYTKSMSLQIPMALIYLAVPVSGFGVIVTTLIKISEVFIAPIAPAGKEKI